jgi:hypothetical protein
MDPPDYGSEEFTDLRVNLATTLRMTEQEAVAHLTHSWRQRFPPPNLPENPPGGQPVNPPDQDLDIANQAPLDVPPPGDPPAVAKKKNFPKFRDDAVMPTARKTGPSEHALRKLRAFDYVELWYFTPRGREETAAHAVALKSESFTITQSDSGLALLPSRNPQTSRGTIVRDEHLSFHEMSVAKNGLIACMEKCGWEQPTICKFMDFYLLLDTHEIRDQPRGDQALVLYQAQACWEWHEEINNGRTAFNIALINEDRLRQIADSIRADTHNQMINVSLFLPRGTPPFSHWIFYPFPHMHMLLPCPAPAPPGPALPRPIRPHPQRTATFMGYRRLVTYHPRYPRHCEHGHRT